MDRQDVLLKRFYSVAYSHNQACNALNEIEEKNGYLSPLSLSLAHLIAVAIELSTKYLLVYNGKTEGYIKDEIGHSYEKMFIELGDTGNNIAQAFEAFYKEKLGRVINFQTELHKNNNMVVRARYLIDITKLDGSDDKFDFDFMIGLQKAMAEVINKTENIRKDNERKRNNNEV